MPKYEFTVSGCATEEAARSSVQMTLQRYPSDAKINVTYFKNESGHGARVVIEVLEESDGKKLLLG